MQTHVNGTRPDVITIAIKPADVWADLDTSDDAIAMLNDALVDAAAARLRLDQ